MADPVIDVRAVSLVRSGRTILSQVDLHVDSGRCCAILGPNGSGKSALVAVIAGYLWPTGGQVIVAGQEYGHVDIGGVRAGIGLIETSRSPQFPEWMTVREILATGLFGTVMLPIDAEVTDDQWALVDRELGRVGLDGAGDGPLWRLSTGEQMKVFLARAMIRDARVLLLDEPTAGLDMGARAVCVGAVDRLMAGPRAPAVIIVSHHLDELPRAVDHVVLLKQGVVSAQGRPDDVLTGEHLSRLFDCRVQVFKDSGRFVASATEGS